MVGRQGEKLFDLKCSEEGVTCNGSTEDDYGWDKLIEYPPRLVPFAAIDMQPGRTVAAVQVKTTTGSSRSVPIRLSNALNYARSPIPHFVVMIVIGDGEPKFFCRHVWFPLVAAWLKAGREADARGVTSPNRETITVAFSPEDERGSALLSWIRSEIEGIDGPYAAVKEEFIRTVGFEEGRYGVGNVTFALEHPGELIDIQLGLKTRVKASTFTYTSERFGIRASKPEIDERDLLIELTPEGRPGAIRLEFPDGGNLVLPATLYSAEDGRKSALRAKARVLDVVLGPSQRFKANAHLNYTDRVKLVELCAFARMQSVGPKAPVELSIELNDGVHDMGSITMKGPDPNPGWPWIALSLDVMRTIVAATDRSPPEFTMAEVNSAAGALEVLNALASQRATRIDFAPSTKLNPKFDGLLAYCSARVGAWVFSAVCSRPAKLDRMVGGRRQISFGAPVLLWAQIAAAENWTSDAVKNAYKRQLNRQPGDGQFMAIGDLAILVESGSMDSELTTDLPDGRKLPLVKPSKRRKRITR